jgi:hypothetical protein
VRDKVPPTRCDSGLQSGTGDGGHDRLLAKADRILFGKEWRQGCRPALSGSAAETSEERRLWEDPSLMEDAIIYRRKMARSNPRRMRRE